MTTATILRYILLIQFFDSTISFCCCCWFYCGGFLFCFKNARANRERAKKTPANLNKNDLRKKEEEWRRSFKYRRQSQLLFNYYETLFILLLVELSRSAKSWIYLYFECCCATKRNQKDEEEKKWWKKLKFVLDSTRNRM